MAAKLPETLQNITSGRFEDHLAREAVAAFTKVKAALLQQDKTLEPEVNMIAATLAAGILSRQVTVKNPLSSS